MGCDYELAVKEPCRIFYISYELFLPFGGKAVFRLVQQIEPLFFDFFHEISECAFSVGMFPDVVHDVLSDILGLGCAAAKVDFF